jgi:carbonic anhydrase/acetyltransferase-like protein (isoleucine patch superfamily)
VLDTEISMALYQIGEYAPLVHETAWVADSAEVIGQVQLSEHASVWFGVVIRGDVAPIRIGRNSNVQDNSVLHADEGQPLTIGENVTVGHQVMLHGCTIGDGALIGIRAVVLNGATIGRNCIVAAGAVVTEGKTFPDGTLILGAPARAVKELTPEQLAQLKHGASHYLANARRFRNQLKKIG